RLFDVIGRRLVDEYPRPDLGLAGAARVPGAEGARGGAQQRETREHGTDERVDPGDARPEARLDLGTDLLLVGEDLGDRRVANILRPATHPPVGLARPNPRPRPLPPCRYPP